MAIGVLQVTTIVSVPEQVWSEFSFASAMADASDLSAALVRPHVTGALPGPRSTELLARQACRESNARTYPRHLPIAFGEAAGCFVRDVDGNVFIDFLAGAGVLSLGHGHPELVRAVTEQLRNVTHGLDFPTPAKDAFTEAQLSMLPSGMRDRMRIHFCGPTGANAVDAAIKLCKTATGRGDIVSFQGGFHGSSHAAMALSGLVEQKAPVPNGMPGAHFFPFSYCCKADRKNLPAPTGRRQATEHAYSAPTTNTEKALADAMADVLQAERLSIDSHFFDDLGANSLLMARFCARGCASRPGMPRGIDERRLPQPDS